ncbi:MAG: hypothetical protein LBQ15_03350 [Clostridium sp.]|nr:hypothetical protein [Clostridium sp.]
MLRLVPAAFRMILRNKWHMLLLVSVYGLGYFIPYGIYWFSTDNNLTSITVKEELYVFTLLPASVFSILNDAYLKYDRQLFRTFFRKGRLPVYSFYIAFLAVHSWAYLLGNTLVTFLSFLFTGYRNRKFTLTHDAVMLLQLMAGIFLIFALLFLFRRAYFAYLAYGAILIFSVLMGRNIFTIFPVNAYAMHTLGYYESLSWELWAGRVGQLVLAWAAFCASWRRYLKHSG